MFEISTLGSLLLVLGNKLLPGSFEGLFKVGHKE